MSGFVIVSCLLLPSFVLQSCGLFLPFWISVNATSECHRGIFYNLRCPADTKGLGSLIIGLQTTSFVIIVLTTVSTIWAMYRDRDGDPEGCSCKGLSTSMICFYPFAGLIGIAGCVVVMVEYGDYDKGWAFYLSFAASCYVIFEVVFCCCFSYNRRESTKSEESDMRRVQEAAKYGSNSGSRRVTIGQTVERHQVGISATGHIIIRKLQFTRLFHSK